MSKRYGRWGEEWDRVWKERLIGDGIVLGDGMIIKEFGLWMGMGWIRELGG